MDVWRIVSERRLSTVLDGGGARLFGGRWNPKGISVVYTSSSLSLAILETLVNIGTGTLPSDLYKVRILIPPDLEVIKVTTDMLPSDWRSYPPPFEMAEIGRSWAVKGATAVISVPSAVVPEERNYILNPRHPDFSSILVVETSPVDIDVRL